MAGLLLIMLAGLINASFVVPIRYVKALSREKIWLYHSIVGLAIIPWLMLGLTSTHAVQNYAIFETQLWVLLIISGFIFGIGQLCFAYAIERIGIALSFTINLSLGITLGSLFVVFYRAAFFSVQGLRVSLAVLLILCGLVANYCASYVDQNKAFPQNRPQYSAGWLLATLAGLASGLQNIAFVTISSHFSLQTAGSYWIWPPFLTAASIPMSLGFIYRSTTNPCSITTSNRLTSFMRNLILISIMGLCFTGSLVLYSSGMNQLNVQQQMIGWPALMLAIILMSQLWGWVYGEVKALTRASRLYRVGSVGLLIMAIFILAIK